MKQIAVLIGGWVRNALIFFVVSTVMAVLLLKFMPVYFTPLMFIRCAEQVGHGHLPHMSHSWVPLDSISRHVPQAVMASEDNLFLKHNGFDFEQIYKARLEAMKGGRERGASTISQQTAKNVFLWPGHNWMRKGLEAYFTLLIEQVWGKQRIMEVYLNSIEMGDGIYGIEAVARQNFGKHASQLSKRQAALVAVTLPNPLKRDSAHPTPYLIKRRDQVVTLMDKIERFEKPSAEKDADKTPSSTKKTSKKKKKNAKKNL
ncbi:MAG: monofunctional biosynthetic peptidoglycan transglycosylase [Muribaculaceae bacterium]|nr:monofunctional biosynthetic peptidoglycan transglycosylase [Muribaculaceae bacterium]